MISPSAPNPKKPTRVVSEFPWGHIQKPIGVADWETKIVESLPDGLKGSLPAVEEIEAGLAGA